MRKEETKYRVVISTNTFAANFDKEACAFMTGQIGQCKIGIDRQFWQPAATRTLFENAMERRLCVDDVWRPVGPNPNDANSFELFFKEKPTNEMLNIIVEGFNEFADEKKEKNPMTNKIVLEKIVVVRETSIYEEVDIAKYDEDAFFLLKS